MLRRKGEQVSSSGLVTQLRHLRATMADKLSVPAALRQMETLLPLLRQQTPQLVPRLASYFYWAILHTGPEDVTRYDRVFGPPPDDPHFNRLQAFAYEQGDLPAKAHASWQKYQKDLAEIARTWQPGEIQRARALLWLRMGKNAAEIPSKKKLARMPGFLRDEVGRVKPLKPPAEKCFQESLKLAPDLLEAHEALFLYEWEEGRPARAIKAGNILLEHFPDHVPTLERLAGLLQQKDRPDEALALLLRALKNNPLNRQLREKVSTAHIYSARAAANQGLFPEAREHYRQALAIDAMERPATLCKWAACEFKAGDAVRAEELLQQARAASASSLLIAYTLLIEVLRFELDRSLKTRFETEFKAGLALPPTAADVIAVLQLTEAHHLAKTEYTGRKTHLKQVLTYTEKARNRVSFTEKELADVCETLLELGAGVRSIRGYIQRGQVEFRANPVFPYLEAVYELRSRSPRLATFRVGHLLGEAERLARAMPEGPEKEAMIAKITREKQALELFTGFNPFPMPGFFDMFEDDDEYEDEDDDEY